MKPTRDDILAEPAGTRLNQWVAEYVTHWQPSGLARDMSGNPFPEPMPDYSGEIAAAWHVVEKILSQHTQDIYFGWCIVPPVWRFGFSKKETHCFNDHGAVANSAPLAICRAALLVG